MSVTPLRRCRTCETELPASSRRDRVYCSPRCRTAAYDERHRAVMLEQRDERDELVERLAKRVAEMTEEPALVARVVQAATGGQWRAAAFLLERLYPDRWARTTRALVDEQPRNADPVWRELDELARRRTQKLGR